MIGAVTNGGGWRAESTRRHPGPISATERSISSLDHRRRPISGRWVRLAAAMTYACGGLVVGEAEAAGRPPAFLQSCTIAGPQVPPFFPLSATGRGAIGAGADQGGETAQGEDDGEVDDDGSRGFLSPGSNTCIAISGSVSTGFQGDRYKANALARATGQVPVDATSFPLSASFRMETGQTLANGLFLGSAFELSFDAGGESAGDATVSEASVTLGPLAAGLTGSRFDFWTGDDFVFVARIPSRTVALIGYERRLTETISLSLSAEDVSADRRTPSPTVGARLPDGVLRLLYQADALTLHGAVAMRDVPRLGGASALGRAAILGATWQGSLLDRQVTLSAQIAGAIDAAPYIGSQLDRRTVFSVLGGDEAARGWSGVVSVGKEWTGDWSTNAYVSRYSLSLPRLAPVSGRIQIDRVAANVVWAPVDGLRLGLELSMAWQRIDLAGRAATTSFTGRQSSAQLFIDRTF